MRLYFERGTPDRLETLHPAYFALVMATGIVAIAAHLHGVPFLPPVLFWCNLHRYLAIADYEDRFVIPTSHREQAEDAYGLRGSCGFTFGNGCDFGPPRSTLFTGTSKLHRGFAILGEAISTASH